MPYVRAGSGADVFTELLGRGLAELGHPTSGLSFHPAWQYVPDGLRLVRKPSGCHVTVANSWNGFAFHRRGSRLVVVEHHCVLDPAYAPYRTLSQRIFHDTLVKRFERRSFDFADAVVTVSNYTADIVSTIFPGVRPRTIPNGIDVDYFVPRSGEPRVTGSEFRLLFVGNASMRKGADLLPRIMERLGRRFLLEHTAGLRAGSGLEQAANVRALGRLSLDGLRDAYRRADVLLFPTRLEGFGYAAAEAMACGTPVVATRCSSLPELIDDGVTGYLCELDNVEAFVETIRALANDRDTLETLGKNARAVAEKRFRYDRMARDYATLFAELA
jgi:glycosyltransferase involved in cell wall biosynthesis